MALSSAILTAGGVRPVPSLVMAINMPGTGWTLPVEVHTPVQILPRSATDALIHTLAVTDIPIWKSLASVPASKDQVFTWYLAGTLPEWQGTPLALALLLEQSDPQAAIKIGQEFLRYALLPDHP